MTLTLAPAIISLFCLLAWVPPQTEMPVEVALEQPPQAEEVVRFDGDVVIRATIRNAQDLMLLNQLSDDPWSHSPGIGGASDWRLTRDRLPVLRTAGVPFTVIISDVQALVQGERDRLTQRAAAVDWFADFKNLADVNAKLDAVVAAHPATCSIVTAGTSIQGRTIRGIRISRHPTSTPVPAFVFTATQHAREWAATMTAMWFIERLSADDGTDARITAIVDASEVFVFPVVNPDGYEYSWVTNRMWRKNRRLNSGGAYGVDLNRNWGTGWGGSGSSGTQSSETYRGTAAFSEPESAGFRDFMLPRTNMAGHIDIHSYSQMFLWPTSYVATLPPDQASFSKVGTAVQTAIKSQYNKTYTIGSSYTTYGPTAGCIEDWTYTVVGNLGFCVEVRDTGTYGFIMPASEIAPNVIENFAGAKVMMEELLKASTISLVSGPGSSIDADRASPVKVTVTPNVGTLIATNPVRLKWQVNGGSVQSAAMTVSGSQRVSQVPAIACDQSVTWWVEAETNFAITRWPQNVPGSVRTSVASACGVEGDLDGDGVVSGADIALLLLDFGSCPGCAADLDASGTVDAGDVALLLLMFG